MTSTRPRRSNTRSTSWQASAGGDASAAGAWRRLSTSPGRPSRPGAAPSQPSASDYRRLSFGPSFGPGCGDRFLYVFKPALTGRAAPPHSRLHAPPAPLRRAAGGRRAQARRRDHPQDQEDERRPWGSAPHPGPHQREQRARRSPRHGHPKGYTTPARAASSTRSTHLPAWWRPCPARCRDEPARAEESQESRLVTTRQCDTPPRRMHLLNSDRR